MIISIIGAGALGKLYGGLLALSGHEVHFLLRSEYPLIQKQAMFELKFQEWDQSYRIEKPRIYQDPQALPKADLVIICLKTTENHQLETLLKNTLKPESLVLVIQNGIGNEAYIQEFCPTQTIISSISTVAATRKEHALVDIYFLGELRLAAFNPQQQDACETIPSLFTTEIKPLFTIYDNYQLMRWQKLIWNVPFGALSIMFNQSCDILASTKPFINMVRGIMEEIQTIAQAAGAEISTTYIDKTIEGTCLVKDYYPSMYWDFTHGKPIEKEYIIDNVLKIAKQHNIATPMLHLIESGLSQKLNAG